jgi:hypothetical protein
MFVPHALVLQQSIARHSPDALFAFYCTDDATARVLERYASPKVLVVAPRAFETERLRAARQGRKLNEYRWTCKPAVLLHAFASLPRLDWAGWVDADMLAFSDLDSALHQHPEASAILTPHAFSLPEFAKLEPAVGRFNAGYIAFRNNADGLAALNWWFERCLEGCPAQPMPGRFGDQKYLDVMAEMFPRVAQSRSPGLNCAPWNVFGKAVEGSQGRVTIDGSPLVLYHYQGLKVIRSWLFDLHGALLRLPDPVRRLIYAPYLHCLMFHAQTTAKELQMPWMGIDPEFVGLQGFWKAAKRLLWSSNLIVRPRAAWRPRRADEMATAASASEAVPMPIGRDRS